MNGKPKIALLAWGSLIWDDRYPEFDAQHHDWIEEGPILPLEFSRVSKSRNNALTLVIDPVNGQECRVSYGLSRRTDPADAIEDLRIREDTVMRHMGFHFTKDLKRTCEPSVPDAIRTWAVDLQMDAVIWTGLPSNFSEKNVVRKGQAFSLDAAAAHLQALTPQGKADAATYIQRAPAYIQTPLRRRLQAEAWFTSPIARQDATGE